MSVGLSGNAFVRRSTRRTLLAYLAFSLEVSQPGSQTTYLSLCISVADSRRYEKLFPLVRPFVMIELERWQISAPAPVRDDIV